MADKKVLAVVGGNEITQEDLNAFLTGLPKEQQMYASNEQFQKQCLEQLISINLFAKMGEDLKLDETEAYAKIMKSAKTEVLAQLAVSEVMKKVTVEDEEVEAYYEVNQKQFVKGATVQAKHILVAEEDACKEILAAIESGEKTFEDAAKESSTCPSGQRGGDLGEFGKGQMVKEFEDAAFTAEIGQVVGPVKTQFGYHLIKVEKKNEEKVSEFAEVEASIKRNLAQQKQNDAYMAKVSELRAKYVQE